MRKNLFKKALCLVLAGSMLAGCSSGTSAPTEGTKATTGETTATAAGSSAETPTEAEKSSKISDKELTVSVLMTDSPTQPLINYAPAQQEIFRRTNIKLDYQIVPSSSYKDKKNILLGTNNFPDLVYVTMDDVTSYGPTGIFEPLTQYINEETMPNFYKFWQEYPEMQKYCLDGELYMFPVVAREETANGFGPVIRTDLLEENNIPIPQTFDELLDALIKLKEIYPDSIPWTGRKGTSQMLKTVTYMLGSGYGDNGLYYDHDVNGGSYVFGPATQEFKEVLSFLNRAFEAGVLDPDFATTTSEQFESKLSSGKSFFYLDNSGFGINYTKALRKLDGMENATMQVIPIPENSFGQRRAVSYAKALPGRFYALNASAKNKEEIIKFIDWMYSDEGSDISNYGVEGESFEYNANGEPEFKKDFVMKYKDAQPSTYYAIYSDLGITKLNFSLYACNTKTWFEIEKLAGNWDDVSDEYWSIIENDKAYRDNYISPPLSVEDSEKVKDILVELNTMLEQEYNKYIMGVEPIENWDKVIEKAEELGARELEKIYNDANAQYK